jgi:hypothetical protein
MKMQILAMLEKVKPNTENKGDLSLVAVKHATIQMTGQLL